MANDIYAATEVLANVALHMRSTRSMLAAIFGAEAPIVSKISAYIQQIDGAVQVIREDSAKLVDARVKAAEEASQNMVKTAIAASDGIFAKS